LSVIQADVKFGSLFNVNDSGLCERLVHFTMLMIQAEENV